jgi:phosphate-selective porin
MAQVSYFLTGENSSYGSLKPFDPLNGQCGAFDVTARISNVAAQTRQFQLGFANPSIAAKTATEFAMGINWYLKSLTCFLFAVCLSHRCLVFFRFTRKWFHESICIGNTD